MELLVLSNNGSEIFLCKRKAAIYNIIPSDDFRYVKIDINVNCDFNIML